jgi:hypothetical protein
MPNVTSLVRAGKLTFTPPVASGGPAAAAIDFACQATSIAITPNVDEQDATEVLCPGPSGNGLKVGGTSTTNDTLDFTIITDWSDANGLVAFSWAHRGQTVSWEVEFDNSGTKWSGQCIMQALQVGGTVGEQVTVDGSLKITNMTPPNGFGTGSIIPMPLGANLSKGAAAPGNTFPAEVTITASDATNAAKLAALGYTAKPQTVWTTGQSITVGAYAFHWDGTAWAAGAAS